jgi:hypothetical protein
VSGGAHFARVLYLCIHGVAKVDTLSGGMFPCGSSISLINLKENEFFTVLVEERKAVGQKQ